MPKKNIFLSCALGRHLVVRERVTHECAEGACTATTSAANTHTGTFLSLDATGDVHISPALGWLCSTLGCFSFATLVPVVQEDNRSAPGDNLL